MVAIRTLPERISALALPNSTMTRFLFVLPLWIAVAAARVSQTLHADDGSSGGWHGDEPKPADASAKIETDGDTLRLLSDTDTTFTTTGLAAYKGNGTVTLEVEPVASGSGKTIKLDGPLQPGTYTTIAITSSNNYILALPSVTTTASGPRLSPAGANLAIGSLTGNTLGFFNGPYLQIESGTWTLTGDNGKAAWNTAIVGGNLVIPPGAALGSGPVSILGTLSPLAGVTLPNYLNFGHDSTLNLADGKIGTFTSTGVFGGPNGSGLHLKMDVGPDGVDQLILTTCSNTNDIKDYLELNLLPGALKSGTYKIVTLANGNIIENHLGFDFTGDPANHDNIVKTKTIGGYIFTIDTLDENGKPSNYQGNYNAYTLTIAPAAAQ